MNDVVKGAAIALIALLIALVLVMFGLVVGTMRTCDRITEALQIGNQKEAEALVKGMRLCKD
jgi:hypothetical protein